MRIMVLGAGGFIGRHIMSELLSAGHDVIGVVRNQASLMAVAFPRAEFLTLDLTDTIGMQTWGIHLDGVNCIVNAAGILRGPDMFALHVDMPKVLCEAAKLAGVRQVVLISAISARSDVTTDYSVSKLAGEEVLRASGLNWTILRPSLVYGEGSYGGTSLLRGMAALPFVVPLPGSGEFAFTPIHVRDLARCVQLVCGNEAFFCQTLEPVGPETLSLQGLLSRYRSWLGLRPAPFLSIPMPIMKLLGRLGDLVGDGPIATNSLVQMIAGNSGDSTSFTRAVGFAPRSLDDALQASPAEVQDRWHARLFFLAPAIKAVLISLWLASAWLGLFYGSEATHSVLAGLGLSPEWAFSMQIGGSLLDIVIAGVVLFDRGARWSTMAQLAVVFGYTLVIGMALPRLWLDPLGPMLKNLPVMLLIAVHGVIGNKR